MNKIAYFLLAVLLVCSTAAIAQPGDEPEIDVEVPPPPPPPSNDETEVFKVVEEMPRFGGCEDIEGDLSAKKLCAEKKMLEFIYKNIKYPIAARKDNKQGTVVIRFVVDEKGNVIQPKIVRDIGGGCGTEALRVVKKMPTFTPGKQRGKAVKVQFNLPVRFKLDKDEKPAPKPIIQIAEWDDLFCKDFKSGTITKEVLEKILTDGSKPTFTCNTAKPHHFHVILMGKGSASEVKKKKWGKRMHKLLENASKGSSIVIHYDEKGKLITKNLTVK